MSATILSKAQFYREFLMSRHSFKPQDFGVDLSREEFDQKIIDNYAETFRDGWSIDELVLHPADAMQWCSGVRTKCGWHYVPDEIILRVMMIHRKSPNP